jgi:hypothetical protein
MNRRKPGPFGNLVASFAGRCGLRLHSLHSLVSSMKLHHHPPRILAGGKRGRKNRGKEESKILIDFVPTG